MGGTLTGAGGVASCSSFVQKQRGQKVLKKHTVSFCVVKSHVQVLRDEYAIDFGFDYSTDHVTIENVIADDVGNTFKILGTSANDVNSHPHVLSPPLMDALTNFLPPEIQGQNFWMRYVGEGGGGGGGGRGGNWFPVIYYGN